MSRHVDLIAIALLLLGIAFYTNARSVVVISLGGAEHYIRVPNSGRQVTIPQMPMAPRAPRIPFQRD